MLDIEAIRRLIKEGKYHYSNHAKDMMFERSISETHVVAAVLKGEVLETYTEDIRGKSYLVLGEGPLHVVVGYNKYRQKAIIVTAYIPEKPKWISPRKRGR
ncbi:MAG: DUF4258 domain-containing protein [Planctomycetes bacterium]|nr:DUF4258 domain-containing protein [Planctomycetota bacterium]